MFSDDDDYFSLFIENETVSLFSFFGSPSMYIYIYMYVYVTPSRTDMTEHLEPFVMYAYSFAPFCIVSLRWKRPLLILFYSRTPLAHTHHSSPLILTDF